MTIHYGSGQASTLLTSFLYWTLPFQIITLSIITVYTSRFTVVLWAAQLALPPRVWKRYVDDSFMIIKNYSVSSFHDTLTAIDPNISFTIEVESNGQIVFLDTLVPRRNGDAVIVVYRKPTHTDRYLDFSSHHKIKLKISTASTLLFQASNIPSSNEGKTLETNHVMDALKANGGPSAVISNIFKRKPPSPPVPPPEELVSMFFNWVKPSNTYQCFSCLPYISGLAKPSYEIIP